MTEEKKKPEEEDEVKEEDLKKVSGGVGGVEHTDTWSGEGATKKGNTDGSSK
jgi:hypothetical protein